MPHRIRRLTTMGSGKMLASLPMAVAIALSPFAIIPAIVLLLTPRPRPTAGAFLVGWVLGVALVVILAVAVLDLRDAYAATPRWTAWARLLLGATLLVLAIVRWGRRGGPAPAWLQSVQQGGNARGTAAGMRGAGLSTCDGTCLYDGTPQYLNQRVGSSYGTMGSMSGMGRGGRR